MADKRITWQGVAATLRKAGIAHASPNGKWGHISSSNSFSLSQSKKWSGGRPTNEMGDVDITWHADRYNRKDDYRLGLVRCWKALRDAGYDAHIYIRGDYEGVVLYVLQPDSSLKDEPGDTEEAITKLYNKRLRECNIDTLNGLEKHIVKSIKSIMPELERWHTLDKSLGDYESKGAGSIRLLATAVKQLTEPSE